MKVQASVLWDKITNYDFVRTTCFAKAMKGTERIVDALDRSRELLEDKKAVLAYA